MILAVFLILQVPDTRYLARVGQTLLDFLLNSLPIALPASSQLATQVHSSVVTTFIMVSCVMSKVSVLSNTSAGSQTGGQGEAGGQLPEAGVRLDSLLADIMICVQVRDILTLLMTSP